jgi:hypothetical protein
MANVSYDEGFTRHAAIRVQQRAIPPVIVEYLLEMGVRGSARGGAESYHFCKKGWRRFQTYMGPAAKHFEQYRHVYAILADGQVVTVAYAH